MSPEPHSLNHLSRFGSTLVLPICLMLSACGGGGGGGVASIPPPPPTPAPTPTPTPTPAPLAAGIYPLTRVGSYDLVGTIRGTANEGTVAPGEFNLTVSKPAANQGFDYRFDTSTGFLPGGIQPIAYGPSNFAGMSTATRGSYSNVLPYSADTNLASNFSFDAGHSYVSMGEWDWWLVHLDGGTAGGFGELLFVFGDRTPQTGIPASGTATYDSHTMLGWISGTFVLTADFGQRLISTQVDQDYRYNPAGDIMDYPLAIGLHVAGSAPFSNSGDFDIPLAGTANIGSGYPINTPATPPSQPVTGSLDGAFFGPHAEQIGGVLSLDNSGGVQLIQDAFVGQQRVP